MGQDGVSCGFKILKSNSKKKIFIISISKKYKLFIYETFTSIVTFFLKFKLDVSNKLLGIEMLIKNS